MKSKVITLFSVLTLVLMLSFGTINVMAAENNNKKEISKVEIKCEKFTKNDSTENSIESGSGSTFSATVMYSDGTVATGDDAKVKWNISGGNSENNIYTSESIKDDKSNIYVYAPYHYSDKLVLTATSVANANVSGSYDVEVFDKHSSYSPSNFFSFNATDNDELTVTGEKPVVTEKWNNKTGEYETTAPENPYKIDGYTFLYWKDEDGNKYNVGDKIAVKTTGNPSVCHLYGVWKADETDNTTSTNTSTSTTSSSNANSTPDEYSNNETTSPKTGSNDMLIFALLSISLLAVCGVCIYKIKR